MNTRASIDVPTRLTAADDMEPPTLSVPIPCEEEAQEIEQQGVGGGSRKLTDGPGEELSGDDVVTEDLSDADAPKSETAARGWVVPPGGSRVDALFLVSSERLGIGRSESHDPPIWFELADVVNLDAIGDAHGGLLEVEMEMEDGTTVSAGWPEAFCGLVVEALTATRVEATTGESLQPDVDQGDPNEEPEPTNSADSTFSVSPVVRRRSRRSPSEDTADSVSAGETPDHAETGPSTGAAGGHAALELEDVTYLGGMSGQPKRRKRCVATLTGDGIEVRGPGDMKIQVAWDSVKSIETQNSDEARFRTNTKIHRDSSALVIDCADGTTMLLEARDCPTVPLRAAINQLLGHLPVDVV